MRKELYPLFGIVTVLNTPFAADGQVSLDALEKHIHYAIGSGVAGFLLSATAADCPCR